MFRLTEQQLRHFDAFGFLALRGLLANEIGIITDVFEQIWAGGRWPDGKPHDGENSAVIPQFVDQNENLCGFLDDPRIDGIARALLRDDSYNYTVSSGHRYVGDTPWHSDQSDQFFRKKYLAIKMSVYLDPVTRDTGCLRVIPGSNHFGDKFADALRPIAPNSYTHKVEEVLGIDPRDMPSVALEVNPGDLIVFDHKLKHASFGGNVRRLLAINFQQRYREEDLSDLREEIEALASSWVESVYDDMLVRTASPSRMRHLEQRLQNVGRLPELARKARQEMSEPDGATVKVEDNA